MNDMDLLTSFRASVPETPPSPQAEARFRSVLPISERRGPFRRGPVVSRGARLAFLTPVAAGVAAAVALALFPARGPAPSATLTVKLLADQAASAALRQPSVSPTQWVYRELRYKVGRSPVKFISPDAGVVDTWETADGTQGDLYPRLLPLPVLGPLPGLPTYADLGSLPSDPAILEAHLAGSRSYMPWADRSRRAFYAIESILTQYAVPPRLAAELYRALAYVPGVTVNAHARDAAGRPGVAFVLPGGSISEIILNPRTDTYMGMAGSIGVVEAARGKVALTWVTYQVATIRQAFVSGNGVRP